MFCLTWAQFYTHFQKNVRHSNKNFWLMACVTYSLQQHNGKKTAKQSCHRQTETKNTWCYVSVPQGSYKVQCDTCHLQVTSWFTGAGNWEILVKTQVLSVNCSTLACNTGSFFPTFKDKQRLTWQKRTLTHNKILRIILKLLLNWPVPECIKTFHQPVKTRKIRGNDLI